MMIVFTTVSTQAAGEELAEKLVDARLAACVQVLPRMTSVYVWEGRVTKEGEHLVLIKTLGEKFDELTAFIEVHHNYDVPEIMAIETDRVSGPYLEWMQQSLGAK